MTDDARLFTKDFFLAIIINLFLAIVFFLLVTGMAVYATEEFAAGETAAGFAASAFVVGALCARVFAGKYVNFLGRRRTILACLVAYVIAGLAYLVVDTYTALIILRLAHGIAFAFGQTALNAAVFELIPKSRRGEGAGYYLLANSLPPALGPLGAIQLTAHYGFWAMFVATTALSMVAWWPRCSSACRSRSCRPPGSVTGSCCVRGTSSTRVPSASPWWPPSWGWASPP